MSPLMTTDNSFYQSESSGSIPVVAFKGSWLAQVAITKWPFPWSSPCNRFKNRKRHAGLL